jgi:uncharacterized protein involved in exopolysaccharide biosynthesis
LTVKALQSRLHVAPAADADVLEVTYAADAPETAQRTLQQLLEVACTIPAAADQAERAGRLAEKPTGLAIAPSSGTTPGVTEERGSARPTASDVRQEELLQRLKTADDAHSAIVRQLAAVRAPIRKLTDWLDQLSVGAQPPPKPRIDQGAIEELRARLNELQVADATLSARLTDVHPARVSLRRQRARLEQRLQQVAQAAATPMPALDSVRRNLELALRIAEAHQARLESQAAESAAQRADLVRQIAALAVLRPDLPQPAPEPRAAAPRELNPPEEGAARLRVLQAATMPDRPSVPRPSVWLAAGICLATLSSIAAVALAERRNSSFSRPDQISRRLGLPVLATVPRVQRNSA